MLKKLRWLLLACGLALAACDQNASEPTIQVQPSATLAPSTTQVKTTQALQASSTLPPPTATAPSPTDRPQSGLGIIVPGNTEGWLSSGVWLEAGDTITLSVSGTIDIWPNCEETKASAGFADLDCTLVTMVGPGGTNAFDPAKEDYPYPGGPVAALVGRVEGGAPFLIGEQLVRPVENSGVLAFAINDVTSMSDNGGEFVVQLTIPYAISPTIAHGDWQETGILLTAGQAFTVTASGAINMWPNCEETKAEQGYPNFDCSITAAVGPSGTDAFSPGQEDYPLPGANTLALLGRVGNGPIFVIGAGGVFTAPQSGPLLVTTNDTAYWKQDDQGIFIVTLIPGKTGETINLELR
ncbi:MAG: hypothetical protein ACOYYS_13520 [Chloroflexota bacterium]